MKTKDEPLKVVEVRCKSCGDRKIVDARHGGPFWMGATDASRGWEKSPRYYTGDTDGSKRGKITPQAIVGEWAKCVKELNESQLWEYHAGYDGIRVSYA